MNTWWIWRLATSMTPSLAARTIGIAQRKQSKAFNRDETATSASLYKWIVLCQSYRLTRNLATWNAEIEWYFAHSSHLSWGTNILKTIIKKTQRMLRPSGRHHNVTLASVISWRTVTVPFHGQNEKFFPCQLAWHGILYHAFIFDKLL